MASWYVLFSQHHLLFPIWSILAPKKQDGEGQMVTQGFKMAVHKPKVTSRMLLFKQPVVQTVPSELNSVWDAEPLQGENPTEILG